MVSQKLIDYIKGNLNSFGEDKIREVLLKEGYPQDLVNNAIKSAIESNPLGKEPGKREKSGGIWNLRGKTEQIKEQFSVKKEGIKKREDGLNKKEEKLSGKNSKVLIAILITIIILGAGFFVFRGFSDNKPAYTDKKIHLGLVTNINGLGDNSFNDLAYGALLDSKEKYGIEFDVSEPKDLEETEKNLRNFSEQKFDLIISIGFNSVEVVNDLAVEFPDNKFVIIDGVVDKPNVASITFKEEEGSYLAGIMAGMMTKSNKIGFIGGMDIPAIQKFETGFIEGVKSININASVVSQYLFSDDLIGFNSPEKGKENAINLYDDGIDIIYHAAGLSGGGIIEAAKEKDKYVIGVDFNQDYMAKGNVLTSMVKNVDVALSIIIDKLINDSFEGRFYEFGLSDNCIGLTEFEYTKDIIPEEVIEKIEQAEQDIKNRKIKVLLD